MFLSGDSNSNKFQAFPLIQGRLNKTLASGVITNASLLYCVEDGSVSLQYESGAPETVNMYHGDCHPIGYVVSFEVLSGTFHYC